MEKFIIDYCTGVSEVVEVYDLDEAKEIAKERMNYTQENVIIKDEEGNEITRSNWYGVTPTDEDQVLCQFGSYGFYQVWQDELENM